MKGIFLSEEQEAARECLNGINAANGGRLPQEQGIAPDWQPSNTIHEHFEEDT